MNKATPTITQPVATPPEKDSDTDRQVRLHRIKQKKTSLQKRIWASRDVSTDEVLIEILSALETVIEILMEKPNGNT